MKVLVVGAGAVGQIYAHYLIKGGAEVSFYCKEKYKAELEAGLVIFQYGLADKLLFAKPKKRTLGTFGVLTTLGHVQAETFEYILVTVSSTALRSGWFPEFVAASQGAVIVSLQLAIEDGEYIKQYVNEAYFSKGLIQFSSYLGPLPGTNEEAGLHYMLPPIAGLLDGAKSQALSKILNRGGFRNHLKKNLEQYAAKMGTITIPLIAVLELANWQLKEVYKKEYLPLGLKAGAEAKAVTLAIFGSSSTKVKKPMNTFLVQCLFSIIQWLAPYNFEKFLGYHFNKVNDQTLLMLKDYKTSGEKYEIETPAIEKIINSLENS